MSAHEDEDHADDDAAADTEAEEYTDPPCPYNVVQDLCQVILFQHAFVEICKLPFLLPARTRFETSEKGRTPSLETRLVRPTPHGVSGSDGETGDRPQVVLSPRLCQLVTFQRVRDVFGVGVRRPRRRSLGLAVEEKTGVRFFHRAQG